jgi:hypothetical protein
MCVPFIGGMLVAHHHGHCAAFPRQRDLASILKLRAQRLQSRFSPPRRAKQVAEPDGDTPVSRPRPARPIRGRQTPDEFMRGVVHAYLEATQSVPPRHPRAVVDEWDRDQYHAGVGKNVVATWIGLCRNRIDPKTGTTFLPKAHREKSADEVINRRVWDRLQASPGGNECLGSHHWDFRL